MAGSNRKTADQWAGPPENTTATAVFPEKSRLIGHIGQVLGPMSAAERAIQGATRAEQPEDVPRLCHFATR